MKMKLMAATLAAAIASTAAFADKVTFKSGSYLTGKAGKVEGGDLNFVSDDLGEMKIAVDKIATLESGTDHLVVYTDKTEETKVLTVKDGEFIADGKALDMERVKAIDPAPEQWHGAVNAGWQSARGNTYKNSGSVLAEASRRWEKDRVTAKFGYYFTETGTSKKDRETSERRWEVEAQNDYFVTGESFYIYGNGRYEQDEIAGLDYRLTLGAGVGYQWLDKFESEATGVWDFNQEVGAAWVKQDFKEDDPDAEDSYAALRYAHHLKYLPKWTDGVEIFHNFEYLPQVDDWDNYLMKADIGVTTKLILDFDLLAKIEWDYNSTPAAGRKSSDTRYIVGLGYKW